MPHATAAFMFARVVTIGADAPARRQIIRVPLITALLDEPRYSIRDPRDPVPVAPKPPAKPPRRSSGLPGRPRKFHMKPRDGIDPLIARLIADDDGPIE